MAKKQRIIAQITIRGAQEMNFVQKKRIAGWLVEHAGDILASGHRYARVFRGKFYDNGER